MASRSPVFIIGMPRCRTAWLSVCASALGVDCSHEAIGDFATFEGYADDLDSRLASGPAGDSDSGLVYWLPQILERWPGARLAVITRDDREGLESLVKAAGEQVRAMWAEYLCASKAARDTLRSAPFFTAGGSSIFCAMSSLENDDVAAGVLEWLTGRRPSALWMRRMQRLRVTSVIDPGRVKIQPPKVAPVQLAGLDGFDTFGLSAALYQSGDFPMAAQWWEQHGGGELKEASLPPLGIVVSDDSGPVSAVWCYESFGVPVGQLTFPVTRPGLAPRRAAGALAYALAACVATAGKGHEPEASFRFFKVFAPPSMVAALERLGFQKSMIERTAMTLTL